MTDDQTWQDAVEDAVHGVAGQFGLDPDQLLDVDLDDNGDPVGDGIDFMSTLDPLADADPTDETFAPAVEAAVADYAAAHTDAEPVEAKALEYNDDLHPHKGPGPGGGQFASTNTSSTSSARGKLTYSGVRQGTGRYSRGGGQAAATVTPYKATATLKKGRNNDPAAVMQLQHMLNELGLAGITADGNFGNSTEAAVKAVQAKLGLKQTGSATPALQKALHDAHTLSPCVDKGATKVTASASYVEAAAGRDVTPGHDELHHYWTLGKGRRRWVNSPTPWTTLLANLVEEVPGKPLEVLKKWASRWFIEVKGYSAGSDLNRVAHGHPPRGKVIGPG